MNTASLEQGGQKRNGLAYDRQGKMHMVKATLLELQPEAESEGPTRTAIDASRQELGRETLRIPCVRQRHTPNQRS